MIISTLILFLEQPVHNTEKTTGVHQNGFELTTFKLHDALTTEACSLEPQRHAGRGTVQDARFSPRCAPVTPRKDY